VPADRVEAVRRSLAPFGLKLGRDGVVRVEVRARAGAAR
jgi:hypothetical protein